MTPSEFKAIRQGLLLTQQELADLLGYAHKIRISEFERPHNRRPIPEHIEDAMLELKRTGGRLPKSQIGRLTRDWSQAA
jgi:DNA-binding transcriptional regulator YiaG